MSAVLSAPTVRFNSGKSVYFAEWFEKTIGETPVVRGKIYLHQVRREVISELRIYHKDRENMLWELAYCSVPHDKPPHDGVVYNTRNFFRRRLEETDLIQVGRKLHKEWGQDGNYMWHGRTPFIMSNNRDSPMTVVRGQEAKEMFENLLNRMILELDSIWLMANEKDRESFNQIIQYLERSFPETQVTTA